MAIDLRSRSSFPSIKVSSIGAAALTEVQLPSQCNQVTITTYSGTPFYIVTDGGSDGGAAPTDKQKVTSGNPFQFKVGRGNSRHSSIYLISDSGSISVEIFLEEL
tara:strand:+ start:2244 stop:2558 length:315 start_codon:yes stop_codon:yes gene_type:complete